jgi:large subunit ribosomal protein L21e
LWGVNVARRSKGLKSKSRYKMTKHPRQHGLYPVSKAVQDLQAGTRVSIILEPGLVKGQPHPRYHGRIGVVRERRGKAYIVEIRDGGSTKKIISRPEHLAVVGQ